MCNQRKSSLIQSLPLPCDSRYNCDPGDNAVFPSNKVGHTTNNPRKKALGVDVMEKGHRLRGKQKIKRRIISSWNFTGIKLSHAAKHSWPCRSNCPCYRHCLMHPMINHINSNYIKFTPVINVLSGLIQSHIFLYNRGAA